MTEADTIEAEAKRGPGRPPKPAAPVAPTRPETLSVLLRFDTWIGEERISCVVENEDGSTSNRVVDLPYDLAIKLMKERKAERADPLPGM